MQISKAMEAAEAARRLAVPEHERAGHKLEKAKESEDSKTTQSTSRSCERELRQQEKW